jgi:hypothetical protein
VVDDFWTEGSEFGVTICLLKVFKADIDVCGWPSDANVCWFNEEFDWLSASGLYRGLLVYLDDFYFYSVVDWLLWKILKLYDWKQDDQ